MANIWTDERVELLKRMNSEGLSASQMSAEFGQIGLNITRNGIIGKVHRLGFSVGGGARVPGQTGKRWPKALSADRVRNGVGPQVQKINRAINRSKIELMPFVCQDAADIVPLHLSIFELNGHTCHHPFGDGPFTFCGNLTTMMFRSDGQSSRSPYCSGHHGINYTGCPQQKPNVRDALCHGGRAA